MILAIFMIGMAIFFLSHEHVEILKIREQLRNSNFWYVGLGLVFTVFFILSMGALYVNAFKAIGVKVSLMSTLRLYLKRNVVSVFLPAGGFSSLLFFTSEVEKEGVSKSQIHLASTIFGFMSIFSVVVVAIPILGYAILQSTVNAAAIWGFAALLLLTVLFGFFMVSMFKKTWAFHFLTRIKPQWVLVLQDIFSQHVQKKYLLWALFFSIFIEIIGVLHLYISMMALGVEPSLMASMIGYVTMVMLLMASPFLRGLGAIEVSLTFILEQYGYSVVVAASMTLLYRLFEFWIPLGVGMIAFIAKRDNIVLRILPGFLIFVLGLVNIVSALTPGIPERLLFLKAWIPESILFMSNGLILAIGVYLLILFVFLLQGSRRAWYAGIVLSIISAAGHLLKGVDYEEALLAIFALLALWHTRDFYRLKAHKELTKLSLQVLLGSLFAVLLFGVAAFMFLDAKHFHTDFNFVTSVKYMFRVFFLFDDTGLVPQTIFAKHFLNTMHVIGALVLGFIIFSLLKPIFTKPYNSPEERELATLILQKYGASATDYFKIYPDKFYYIADDRDGFISFKVKEGYAIALGNPICKDDQAAKNLIRSFDKFCLDNGMTSVYYRVPKESLYLYEESGKRNVPVGDEGIVDLEDFTLNGFNMMGTRKAIRHLQRRGFTTSIHVPPVSDELLSSLMEVSDNWLHGMHEKESTFTIGNIQPDVLRNQILITVEDANKRVYAFLNVIPDHQSGVAAYDTIRKLEDAPEGVYDMLLVRTMLYLKEQGYQSVNLGMAPLSGIQGNSFSERTARFAYERMKSYTYLRVMRKYKEKFSSRWEQKFLVYNKSYHLPRIVNILRRLSKGK